MNNTKPLTVTAIGRAVSQLQHPISSIRKAALALGIVPAMVINGVEHFTPEDLDRIADHLWATRRAASLKTKELKQ